LLPVKKPEKIQPVRKTRNYKQDEEDFQFSFDAIHSDNNESWTYDNTKRHELLASKKTEKIVK